MTGRGIIKKKRKVISKSQRANVLFPVGRLHRFFKEGTHKLRIGVGAAVYAASVIEYLAAEVLELAGNTARDCRKSRITPRHILFAIATDKELHELLRGVTIASGGVIPHIHPSLFKLKKGSSSPSRSISSPKAPKSPRAAKSPKASKSPKTPKNLNVVGKITKKSLAVKGKTSHANLQAANTSGTTGLSPVKLRAKGINLSSGFSSSSPYTVLSEKMLFLGQKLTVIQTDIATVKADAIVHPTNSNFAMVGQVGQALERVGGKKLIDEVSDLHKKKGDLAACDVAVSPSVNIPSPWIIHVNGPSHGDVNAYDKLEASVKNCLTVADSKNLKSIALPSIGSGRAGFPKQQAAQTILKSICNYFVNSMSSSLKQIYFVLYDMESIGVYTSELAKLDG